MSTFNIDMKFTHLKIFKMTFKVNAYEKLIQPNF